MKLYCPTPCVNQGGNSPCACERDAFKKEPTEKPETDNQNQRENRGDMYPPFGEVQTIPQ